MGLECFPPCSPADGALVHVSRCHANVTSLWSLFFFSFCPHAQAFPSLFLQNPTLTSIVRTLRGIVIMCLSSSSLSFSRTEMLAYLFMKPCQWHSTWHAENTQLRCDKFKCDQMPRERTGEINKPRNRTEWRTLEGTHRLIFLLFAGCLNSLSWHSGPLMPLSWLPYNFLPQTHTWAESLKFCSYVTPCPFR